MHNVMMQQQQLHYLPVHTLRAFRCLVWCVWVCVDAQCDFYTHWHPSHLSRLFNWMDELIRSEIILLYRVSVAIANANTVLFSRFVHVLSPTFLIRLQWAPTHRERDTWIHSYNTFVRLCYVYVTLTHLPLLTLMWPIRFVSISHWSFCLLLIHFLPFTISNLFQHDDFTAYSFTQRNQFW